MNAIVKTFKIIRDLGLPKLWLYASYQWGLRSGALRRATPSQRISYGGEPSLPPYENIPKITPSEFDQMISEADEICQGQVRLFGGALVPLDLDAGASDHHWTELLGEKPEKDIKFIWEPGRLGWAITLARAYAFSGAPIYAQVFSEKCLYFLQKHPPNLGRQWESGQEVAIRLLTLIFCDRVFANAPSTNPSIRKRLWEAIIEHAQRIPPTMAYARAQNNNHLLSEAAGLYAAGCYLADYPQAKEWKESGWRWLIWGFQHQISPSGTYMQHSINYHRLMLQLALWIDHLRRESGGGEWPSESLDRLEAATRWLWALTDPNTGRTPNLGANDGAYILPLTSAPLDDYRPVLDAAAKAFLHQDLYAQPKLAEMARWFKLSATFEPDLKPPQAPDMLRLDGLNRRAFIHATQFHDRPSHADQLHVDLWYHGINIALDPGTYRYNATPPWDNNLSSAHVHNTPTVDGADQMTRVSRFLWVDWAQAEIIAHEINEKGKLCRVTAEHNGYHRLGVLPKRTLSTTTEGWLVTDEILPYDKACQKPHQVTLSWLMPDWDWQFLSENALQLTGPEIRITLEIVGAEGLHLFRGGERLTGQLASEPIWGWHSPTYGVKESALLLLASQEGTLPLVLKSIWRCETTQT